MLYEVLVMFDLLYQTGSITGWMKKPHGSYMNEHYNELALLDSICDRTIIIYTASNCDNTITCLK